MDNIFDSQVKAIDDEVMPWIRSMQGTATNLEDFRQRVIDRFREKAKVEADVVAYYTEEEGTIAFDINITGNLMRWDPDRQVHEITNNVLDIPEDRDKGLIKTDQAMIDSLGASRN